MVSATPASELQREDQGGRVSASLPPAITVKLVSKVFKLPHERFGTLKERALHPFTHITYDKLRALDDVTVDIEQGEFFGIVGRNGSGKSTLLKCLAGIYQIDSGDLHVNGRLAPFIELGVGFNPELTARDNVVLNATLMGVAPADARDRFDDIVAFAELEEFVDLKLKNYSSGMHVRLAFAVATQVDADILLVDEVLAVGDSSFQAKCFDTFERMRSEGKTIILVTHDMETIRRFADRAMLLEHGAIAAFGDPEHVAGEYASVNLRSGSSLAATGASDEPIVIHRADLLDEEGKRAMNLAQGSRVSFRADFEIRQGVPDVVFSLILLTEAGQPAFVANSPRDPDHPESFADGEHAAFEVDFENRLAPGRYHATTWAADAPSGTILARRDNVASVRVDTDKKFVAFDMPHEVTLRRESEG